MTRVCYQVQAGKRTTISDRSDTASALSTGPQQTLHRLPPSSLYPVLMPYPGRPSTYDPDPELAQWAATGRFLPDDVKAFVVREYEAGRSLREIAEVTGRSHGAVRNILQRAGVPRRGRGAPKVSNA